LNQFNGHERPGDNIGDAAARREFLRGRYPDFFNGSRIDLGINKMLGIDPADIDGMRNRPVDGAYVAINDFKLP